MFTLMREGFLPIKSEHLFILPKFRLLYRLYRARLELSGKGEFIKVDNPHAAVAMPVERGAVYALPAGWIDLPVFLFGNLALAIRASWKT